MIEGIIIITFIILIYFMAYRWDVKKGSIKWSDFLLVPVAAIELGVFQQFKSEPGKTIFLFSIIALNIYILLKTFKKKLY